MARPTLQPRGIMSQKKKELPPVKVKFVRNVSYHGVEYGPDYDEDTVVVEAGWARRFVDTGRAIEVEEESEGEVEEESEGESPRRGRRTKAAE